MLLYIISAEVLANFTDADKRIKGIQTGGHVIEIVNFADNITILLRDISCINMIKAIWKLYVDASSSKMNFSKCQDLWPEAYKNGIDQPGQMDWSWFSIKILGVNFGNSILDNSNWNKKVKI